MFILGEKYIASMKEMASAPGSKTVLLPADLMKNLETDDICYIASIKTAQFKG
jgi:hypothetical protein